jgi:cell division septation protein DedD
MVNPDRNLYDPPYDDALLYDNEMEPERPRSRSLVVMLAFVVLAAFAGVVWVAYNQGVQQGQRGINPPLLSADAGPTRIEPDQTTTIPTANPAPEKSYERLWASNGDRPAGQDNAAPGTEQPRNDAIAQGSIPSTQDVATAAPLPKQVNPWDNKQGQGGEYKPALVDPNLGPPSTKGEVEVTDQVPAPSTMTDVSLSKPERVDAPREIVAPSKPKAAPAAPIDAPVTELQSSTPAAPAATPAAASSSVSIQLGSFPTDVLAAAQWSKVLGANQGILGSYKPKFVSAEIPGKGTWTRLRVGGFADKSEAKAVCDQLIAAGQACILAGK